MMAGVIAVSPGVRWSAAGWLFDWTVGFLADRVADPEVAAGLREIVSENLGWLSLDDFGPEAERKLRILLQHELVSTANEQLPDQLPNRSEVLDLLGDLVARA